MSLTGRINIDLKNKITKEYEEASTWLPYSALEIKEVFSEEELEKLEEFIADMINATNENERKAKLIANVSKYAGPVVKLLKMGKIAI